MRKTVFNDWKFLVLILLLLLKALQTLNSIIEDKLNTLELLKRKEEKMIFIQKESKKILSLLKKEKKLHNFNCSLVYPYVDSKSLIEEESEIQNSINSFLRKRRMKLTSFSWGVLTVDSEKNVIKYLPFSLNIRGNIKELPAFLCYLLTLNKLFLVDAFNLTIMSDNRFSLTLSLRLVFLDKQFCPTGK